MYGHYGYAEHPIAGTLSGGQLADDAFRDFLRDTRRRVRYLVEVDTVALGGQLATLSTPYPFAGQSIGEMGGPVASLGSKTWLFSDGAWNGKPQDALRPNKLADARMIASADIDRTLPLSPESGRRSEITSGEITFANADGGMDAMIDGYSPSGRQVRIYVGPSNGAFAEFRLVLEAVGDIFETDGQTARLRIQSLSTALDKPFQSVRYTGTGGAEGDAGLADRLLPIIYGECFNIAPVLINADDWTYQVHDGPIYGVDVVRERGLPLTFSGADLPNYSALRAHDVAAGFYATCLASGHVKLGLGLAGPAGPITMDVRGDVALGAYTSRMGEILQRIAIRRAKLDGGLLDLNSYADLPLGRMGYYADGASDLTVAQVYDAILGSVVGFYGSGRSSSVRVGVPDAPDDPNAAYADDLTVNRIYDIERLGAEQPARYQQGALYAKNWSPLAPDDISEAVSVEEAMRLSLPGSYVRTTAAEVRLRDRSAIAGGDLETFFVEQSDAAAVVDRVMALFRQTRQRFIITTDREAFLRDLKDRVRLTYPRFKLDDGKTFLITNLRDQTNKGRVTLTLWG